MIFLDCPPALRDILLTSMARYSLFVLKVPLNTKQANKKPCYLLEKTCFQSVAIEDTPRISHWRSLCQSCKLLKALIEHRKTKHTSYCP